MTILTHKTLENQAFPVLHRLVLQAPAVARFPARTFMRAARDVADSVQIDPKTIRHLFMRRLGFGTADAFYDALKDWAEGRPERLAAALKNHAPADMDTRIDQALSLSTETGQASPRLRDVAAEKGMAPENVVVLRDLDNHTLALLRQMAAQSGRSVEDEVRELIAYAFRAKREEFIRWTDALRASHRGPIDNLSVADIREDRDNR